MRPKTLGQLRATNPMNVSGETIRTLMNSEGYVYLPGLLDASSVEEVVRDVLRVLLTAEWIDGTGGVNSRYRHSRPDWGTFYGVFDQVISLYSFNRLAYHPELLRMMRLLLPDCVVFVRPMKFIRIVFPNSYRDPTPPHQDFVTQQGTVDAYACWLPLGDCSIDRGPVAIWPGSHKRGVIDNGLVEGSAGIFGLHDSAVGDVQWLTTNFTVGDVVLFHSLTAHRGLPNQLNDTLRLSADFRYQSQDEPVTERVLEPVGARRTWAEIRAEWPGDCDLPEGVADTLPPVVPYDTMWDDHFEEEVVLEGARGNLKVEPALRQIAANCKDPLRRSAARRALIKLRR